MRSCTSRSPHDMRRPTGPFRAVQRRKASRRPSSGTADPDAFAGLRTAKWRNLITEPFGVVTAGDQDGPLRRNVGPSSTGRTALAPDQLPAQATLSAAGHQSRSRHGGPAHVAHVTWGLRHEDDGDGGDGWERPPRRRDDRGAGNHSARRDPEPPPGASLARRPMPRRLLGRATRPAPRATAVFGDGALRDGAIVTFGAHPASTNNTGRYLELRVVAGPFAGDIHPLAMGTSWVGRGQLASDRDRRSRHLPATCAAQDRSGRRQAGRRGFDERHDHRRRGYRCAPCPSTTRHAPADGFIDAHRGDARRCCRCR